MLWEEHDKLGMIKRLFIQDTILYLGNIPHHSLAHKSFIILDILAINVVGMTSIDVFSNFGPEGGVVVGVWWGAKNLIKMCLFKPRRCL